MNELKLKENFEPSEWISDGIPKTINFKLFEDIGQIYELKFAKMELSRFWNKLDDFIKRAAYFEEINGKKTYHFHISNIKGKGQIGSTNQYLTHWFYPYKAKFHPQMIKALINWMGLKSGDRLLDPFVGSGTALVEAKTLGIDSIGTDINPLCVLMAKVKTDLLELSPKELESINKEVAFRFFNRQLKRPLGISSNVEQFISTKNEKELTSDNRIFDFYKLCYLYALSDNRYVNRDLWEGFDTNLNLILDTVRKFTELKKKLDIKLGKAEVKIGDARKLDSIKKVDGIITSPPYSIAVDYIRNDIHALKFMDVDVKSLYKDMVGLRGFGDERILNYWLDMKASLERMYELLKNKGYCVIVVGDVSYNGRRLPIQKKIIELAQEIGFTLIDEVKRPILGGFARLRYECVIILQKD
jgi:tRNA G10  N-methylase Trm11